MQNKPNLPNAQMNVSSILTKDYESERLCRCVQNKANQTQYKANTNPLQTQFPKYPNECNLVIDKKLWKCTPSDSAETNLIKPNL